MKRLLLSLTIGLALLAGVSFVKFTYVDQPAFKAGLHECFKDPLCDPNPFVQVGLPWALGNYDDSSDTWQILSWVSKAGDAYGQRPLRFWLGGASDLLIYTLAAYGILWLISKRPKR
jgi:hypothetical protein